MSTENKTRILLVDDEVDLAEMTAYQLKANGYHVELADNGLAGLKKLEVFTPDIIILDLNMPVMGGLEFYDNVLDDQQNPKYPILILTARAYIDDVLENYKIEGYITKPFELCNLLDKVTAIKDKFSQ